PSVATAGYAPAAIEHSYAEASALVDDLRAAYQSRGLAAGDRVALAFDSRLDVYLHLLALNALGVSIVPLNMGGSDSELHYVIEHSDACLVTGIAEHIDRLSNVFAGSSTPKFVAEE